MCNLKGGAGSWEPLCDEPEPEEIPLKVHTCKVLLYMQRSSPPLRWVVERINGIWFMRNMRSACADFKVVHCPWCGIDLRADDSKEATNDKD